MCVRQCERLWILGKGHPEEAINFPGDAVIGGYEMLKKGAEKSDYGPLEEQQILLSNGHLSSP